MTSLPLDIPFLHHPRPLRHLDLHVLAELGRAHAHGGGAFARERGGQLGRFQHVLDVAIELVDDRLRKEIAAVQASNVVLEQFAKEGAEVVQMSQAEFAKFMVSEMNKWEKVVKETGMKAQ